MEDRALIRMILKSRTADSGQSELFTESKPRKKGKVVKRNLSFACGLPRSKKFRENLSVPDGLTISLKTYARQSPFTLPVKDKTLRGFRFVGV